MYFKKFVKTEIRFDETILTSVTCNFYFISLNIFAS